MTKVASTMEVTDGALRHWLDGRRPITLDDFLKLCATSEADVAEILLGRKALTPKQMDTLRRIKGIADSI